MPTTPNYGWVYPVVGASFDDWGDILNAGGVAIDAEMFKKANANNPVFTGIVTAPAFVGNPSAILRPTVDSAAAIQFQNAAGTPIGAINTGAAGQMSIGGSITTPLYTAATNVVLRPGANGAAAIQFQNQSATVQAQLNTTTGDFSIGGVAPGKRLHVHQPTFGTVIAMSADDGVAANICTAGISMGRSASNVFAIVQGVQTFPSTYGDGDLIFQTCTGGVLAERMRISNLGYVSCAQTPVTPLYRLHISGYGVSEVVTYTPADNKSNTVYIQDAGGGANNGGALLLGAGASAFAAIRALFTNGTGNGQGDLAFYTRSNTAEAFLREALRINAAGQMITHTIPTSNPGAGSHMFWVDTAAGNVVKWAA